MNKEIIIDALSSALSLINSEYESVEVEELGGEYLRVMKKVEDALKELQLNG